MATSQRDVRNRIGAVKNIQKITRAMEMVAAARLRRAEQRIEALRPYGSAIRLMAAYIDDEVDQVEVFYNHYISPVSQEITRETLLPLQQATVLEEEDDGEAEESEDRGEHRAEVEYEPDPEEILTRLVPDYVEI